MSRDIKIKFIVERAGTKYLSQAYSLGPMGFPSYDEVLEQMDGDCTCSLNESNSFCEGDCCEWGDAEVVGQVQSTGLHDKNGVEIYENDLIKIVYSDTPNGFKPLGREKKVVEVYGKVAYKWSAFYVEHKDPRDGEMRYGDLSQLLKNPKEVAGNIHQHPELLK